jgi:cellulose synthase/poly-beta-1,6-N-acetylglucosamine synthase-like glycosyltransferase
MTNIQKYLGRQTFVPTVFSEETIKNLGIIVTIPAFVEEDLITSLESLYNCELPKVGIEVIVIVNHPESASEEQKIINEKVYQNAISWAKSHNTEFLQFLISKPISLPVKHAGAGLARKIAMDEAVRRLEKTAIENPVIAAFDADATCASNYLKELYAHFFTNPNSLGCNIYFEHPLAIESQSKFECESIMQYELHLRYYQAALTYANHPQAEFTVGSSMAVTRDAYVLQGGMNRRKAGEDFWFMLKLMMAGQITSLITTAVYPSSRQSFRVPFGTGRAMMEMYDSNNPVYLTASFKSFERLKSLLLLVDQLYLSDQEIADTLTLQFLETVKWTEIIAEIRLYTTDIESFRKRFYRWFNVFMVMKFFHYLRDQGEDDIPVLDACTNLFVKMNLEKKQDAESVLHILRDKKKVKPEDFTFSIH